MLRLLRYFGEESDSHMKLRACLALLFAAAPIAGTAQPAPTTPRATVAAAFDATLHDWTAKHGVPRASIAVMRHGRLVHAAGFGGRGANERVGIWSLSKAITGACIATLVQERRLDYADAAGSWLEPQFAPHGGFADKGLAGVTIEQLLTHRSGLPRDFGGNRFAPGLRRLLRVKRPDSATVTDLLPTIAREARLTFAPGSRYEYSNLNYLLLGLIIEAITGRPYAEACAERVLAEAGITSPALEPTWGGLTSSSAGWALSGPEYLAFIRLFERRHFGPLTSATHQWLRESSGRWTSETRTNAYTLGVQLFVRPGAEPNIFHSGGWLWNQTDASGGPIRDRRGSWFMLTADGTAWFASYDGLHADEDRYKVNELHEALWQAYRRVSSWPAHDLFPAMGIGAVRTDNRQPHRMPGR